MNGSALKIVPQVNLDEFERRLRAAGAPAGAPEDPLEELARLVGLDASAGKAVVDSTAAAQPLAPPVRLPHIDEPINEEGGFNRLLRIDFGDAQGGAQSAPSPESQSNETPTQYVQPAPVDVAPVEDARQDAAEWAADSPPPRRSGRVKLTVGVLVGLGAAGLVGAWAVKGAPGLPKTPPMILAVDGPTKVQPPSQDTVASPNDSVSMLLKDQANKSAPVKLVSNEEQPVDLQQQTPAAAPTDAAAPGSAPAQQGAERSIASLATVAATAAPPAAPAAPFPEPKRVKTVSVRPDGSLIASAAVESADVGPSAAPQDARPTPVADTAPASAAPVAAVPAASTSPAAPASAAPAAAAPVAAAPVDSAPTAAAPTVADSAGELAAPRPADVPVPKARPSFGALAQSATPKLDLPAKPSAKSTARVPIAKIDTTVAGGSNPAPESPLQIVPNLLGSVARAVGGQPATQVAAADPVATSTTTASAVAPAPIAKTDGSYAVQLAAPGSEQEAQSMSTRLQAKYTAQLDGMQPSIHQADVNGRSIYRVRVSGLSKAAAVALCVKLKAAGGAAACFVAKN